MLICNVNVFSKKKILSWKKWSFFQESIEALEFKDEEIEMGNEKKE